MKKATENVLISSAGIKNSLKRYKPLQALAEYVWNGFDAGASRVDINIYENEIEGVELCLERDRLQKKYSTADEVVEAQKNSTAVMPGEMTLS